MAEAQRRAMEIERHESKAVAKKKNVILDRVAFLEKDIKF
jgi:hypothetical protein